MKRSAAFSLIELLVFISVMALSLVSLSLLYNNILANPKLFQDNHKALQLAQQRMELLLQHHKFNTELVDPCQTKRCATVKGYQVDTKINTQWRGDSAYQVVTVTVDGKGHAELTTLVIGVWP